MLVPRYQLSFEARNKPVVNAGVVYALLEHHLVYDTYVYADERQRI
jgi:hypothetical protein